MDKNSRDVIDG